MEKIRNFFAELKKKWIIHHRLRMMDYMWKNFFGSSFDPFPPSFYYKHTPEEIAEIKEKEFAELKAMVDEYDAKYVHKNKDG